MTTQAKFFLKVDDQLTIASDNSKMGQMIDRILAVSETACTVLIVGKPGSGKELVAKAIHNLSKCSGDLITVNCAAIPSSMLESELFGHVKGAFTDARTERQGRFASAEGGTIFLDEICHMDLDLQTKLLRVVEYGKYRPMGSDETRNSTARIITAVNLDLAQMIAEGRMHIDLYYRLARYVITVPSMEERREDIPRLISFFFDRAAKSTDIQKLDAACVRKLASYDWPGNVRELESVIESAIINASHRKSKTVELSDIDEFPSKLIHVAPSAGDTVGEWVQLIYSGAKTFKDIEGDIRKVILEELRRREYGNTRSIARVLGMNEKAVRSIYARSQLALGSSYKKRNT